MGKSKKGHNWKARQKKETSVVRTEEEHIDVEIPGVHQDNYDEDNPLTLPSAKRKTTSKSENIPTVKRLTKKERKRLEKIVEQKNKKAKRADLLESLQKYQANDEELSLLTSTTQVYSGKLKRKHATEVAEDQDDVKVNAISGSNKKRRKQADVQEEDSDSSDHTSDEETDQEAEEESEMEEEEEEEPEEEEGNPKGGNNNNEETKLKESVASQPEETSTSTSMKTEKQAPVERKPVVHIPLTRTPEIQAARLRLPILGEEQVVMETVNDNTTVVMCGETGCGKTTQVPQFLYEAGYAHAKGIIGVTEPRRVAAISMSKRVAEEMGLSTSEISYQIRYEGNTTDKTKVKFMTDGILLKEVQKDFLLNNYSVIILDEAHERSIFTDLLLGLLSRIVPLRQKKGNPLKVIVMSATLRIEDFTENRRLFKVAPPVIKVDSRQFPVSIHFNKRTPIGNYIGEAFKKVCKIHRKLPAGGILVFVTGQQEVHTLIAKLRRMFPAHNTGMAKTKSGKKTKSEEEEEPTRPALPKISLDDYSVLPEDEEAEVGDEDSESEMPEEDGDEEEADIDEDGEDDEKSLGNEAPLYVLPLYSLLSSDKQAKVFEAPPEGSRLCVVATNVAETSLTIPNVKYVVDTGKVKTKFYDKVTGVSTFNITWTSKASANQRAGRAGRTGPGHCYRLYSSAVFNDEFEQFSPPEITRRPVDDLLLQMKDIGIDRVINFPFPTMPDSSSLEASERLLLALGALEVPPRPTHAAGRKAPCSKITPLGHAMACFPVSPRYGKMLALGHQQNLLPYVVVIVAALSVQEVLTVSDPVPTSEEQKEELKQRHLRLAQMRRNWSGVAHSRLLGDLMVLLKAVGAAEFAGCTYDFCAEHGIRFKGMKEVRKLRAQLTNAVNSVIPDANLVLDPKLPPPSDTQAKLLRQIVLAGLGDHVARRLPDVPPGAENAKKLKHSYQSAAVEDPVFVHPGSVLYKQNAEYVVYQHLEETSKLYMRGVVAIEPEWLPVYVPGSCQFSKPLDDPPPRYDPGKGKVVCHRTATFGPHCWPLPAVELEYPRGLDRYKWFARSLLEGAVCPKLKRFVPSLLSTPATMIKTWAKLQPRTEILLKELVGQEVDCKEALLEAWKSDPQYLLKAYSQWIPQSMYLDLEKVWSTLATGKS